MQTFDKRLTPIDKEHIIFKKEFYLEAERNKRWKDFLKRTGRENIEFCEVMVVLNRFLKPIYDSIIAEREVFARWNIGILDWEYILN